MASAKYFYLKHLTSGAEHLVRASKQATAIAAIVGVNTKAVAASDDDIRNHYGTGGTLHAKSRAEGEGKLFIVTGAGSTSLIRAKNAADAISLISDGDYEVTVTTQDDLVRLLDKGLSPLLLEEPTKPAKSAPNAEGANTPPAANDGHATAGDNNADGVNAAA